MKYLFINKDVYQSFKTVVDCRSFFNFSRQIQMHFLSLFILSFTLLILSPSSFAAITYMGAGTPDGCTGCTTLTPSIPSGNTGDLLIALAIAKEDDGGNNITMAGWNTYYAQTYPGSPPDDNEMQVRIFWRIATGGDSSTMTQSGSYLNGFGGQISRFAGVDTSSPFETASPGVITQNSNNIDTGTITTTSATSMLLVAGFISDNRNVNEGSGWSESFDYDYNDSGSEPDFGITLNYQLQTTSGSKSISNWTFSRADENFGVIFALTPLSSSLDLSNYAYSEPLSITTGPTGPDKRYNGYTVRLASFDTQSLINAGQLQSDCDDLRVIRDNAGILTEVDRHLIDCNSAASDIRFMLQADIADSTTDTNYYLYYGNPSAGSPNPVTTTNIYRWYDTAAINRSGSYTRGRIDAWHGSGWDNSLSWNGAGYYTYNNGDNYTSGYRIAVDERDALIEAEFYHTGCYPNNMTTGVLLRGQIDSGSGGSESSTHYYATNRGHNSSCGGGYSEDGDIVKSFRTTVAVDGTNPPAITNNQWRKMALSVWGINAATLNYWDNNGGWPALAWPDSGSLHISGTDSDYDGRGFAAFITAQDRARVRNIVVRRYVEPEPVVSITPSGGDCEVIFPSTLQNTDAADSITLGWNSQLFNEPDNQLETYNLNDNSGAASSCATDNVNCTAANQNSTRATLPAFENSSGRTNVNTQNTGGTFALGSDSRSSYRQISVGSSDSLTDSGFSTTYHISRLRLHADSTWTLNAGSDYWIETLTVDSNVSISVSGNGTARLFVRDNVTFTSPPVINSAGSAQALFIVGYGNITLSPNSSQNNALIYAQGNVTIDSDTHLTGAIASEGNITLNSSNSQVTYDASSVNSVDHRGLCGSGSAVVDHYSISHNGTGITCEAELVTITAHDASHTAINVSSDTSINISTSPVVDDIITSPVTMTSGSSSATFYLANTTAPASININVSDGTATETTGSATPADDDPALAFVDTAFRFVDTSTQNTLAIGSQIGGKPSSTAPGAQTIGLQPIRTDNNTGECQPAFVNQTTDVDFAYECNNPVSCQPSGLLMLSPSSNYSSGTAISGNNDGSVSNYTAVILNFDTNGIAPLSFLYNDAGEITLHATKTLAQDDTTTPPTSAVTLSGSNQFVVRPFGFYMTNLSTAADATSGNVFAKAGDDFITSLTAKIWASGEDANNDGIPDNHDDLSNNLTTDNFGNETSAQTLSLTHSKVSPADPASSNGSLGGNTSQTAGGGSSDFSSGIASNVTLNWDEVGIIDLTASLGNYLNSSQTISTTKNNVGRFIPHHFDVSNNTPGFSNSCNTFTYLDQPFYYGTAPVLTVTARANGGSITQNYGGGTVGADGFWKLNSLLNRSFSEGNSMTPPSATLSATSAGGITLAGEDDFNGSGTLSQVSGNVGDEFIYNKNGVELPFQADIDIIYSAAAFTDADGVCYDPDNNLTCDSRTIEISNPLSTTELRYGRMVLFDAYGSELHPLNLPVTLEYWNTIGGNNTYDIASDDTCTTLAASDVIFSDFSGNLNSGETSVVTPITLSNGRGNIKLSAPGNNNDGKVCVEYDLTGSGSGNNQPWLQASWSCSSKSSNNPLGQARFGIFPGNSRQIYMRERY